MLGDIFFYELRYRETIDTYKRLLIINSDNLFYNERLAISLNELELYKECIIIKGANNWK